MFASEKPAIVSHQAAQMDVRRAVREPAFDASVNVIGALNVLESAPQRRQENLVRLDRRCGLR